MRMTCRCQKAREFWLKSWKKFRGGGKLVKKSRGGIVVTQQFFFGLYNRQINATVVSTDNFFPDWIPPANSLGVNSKNGSKSRLIIFKLINQIPFIQLLQKKNPVERKTPSIFFAFLSSLDFFLLIWSNSRLRGFCRIFIWDFPEFQEKSFPSSFSKRLLWANIFLTQKQVVRFFSKS